MTDDAELTQDAGTFLAGPGTPRAFLAIHITGGERSRVVELPAETDVTFGRSRGATINVDHEKVSRLHARVRRRAEGIEVEDLGSRNGTRVNGERIEGVRWVSAGDEISVGPILAVVGVTSGLRKRSRIADAAGIEQRLVAEIDRSVRYRRSLAVALVRISDDERVEALARQLRAMDMIGEDAGDNYLVVMPELDRTSARTALGRMLPGPTKYSIAVAPDDGTTFETLIGRLRAELRSGRLPTAPIVLTSGPVVLDPAMRRVYTLAERIADSGMTVLIYGETGVGKELVCEAIHNKSSRHDKPLVKLNCAALPENLLESELFGYERGAFTGADRRKLGFFEAADGGTLFLDEVGEIPLSLQAKLLRVLERKVITRLGGTAEVAVDARVVAATHRDLEAEVAAGRFRQDLLFRIGGFAIVVPALRDRTSEIIPLAEHFIATACAEQGRPPPTLSPEARDALLGYTWPGNVRELKNAIERALVLCTDTISVEDLPDRLRDDDQRVATASTANVRGQLAEVERTAILAALEAENNNQTRAARRLGLSRRALIYKMEKYGLKAAPK